MRIVLLCATRRGKLALSKLLELCPARDVTVFSFRETPWEPPYLDEIRSLAESAGCGFHEARQIGHPRWQHFWSQAQVELMLVVSWRYLLPPAVIDRPRAGTYVFHDSLLPRYRGFSPAVWAIINGETETGATLFRIAEGVDAGEIVDQRRVPIGPEDTIAEVMDRVTLEYLRLLEANFQPMLDGTVRLLPNDDRLATYTCRRLPEDNGIDWNASTDSIHNLVRAVTAPYPGAFTRLAGRKLIVWEARRLERPRLYVGRVPGRVVEIDPAAGSIVLTGDGSLLLTKVQLEGEPIAPAAKVLNSVSMTLET